MAEFLKLSSERHHTTYPVAFISFFPRLVDNVEKLRGGGRQAAWPAAVFRDTGGRSRIFDI